MAACQCGAPVLVSVIQLSLAVSLGSVRAGYISLEESKANPAQNMLSKDDGFPEEH